MSPLHSPLYRRLLLSFVVANIATLLVSVTVSQYLARLEFGGNSPDWVGLGQEANAAYESGGLDGLFNWSQQLHHDEHINATLYEDGRDLLDRHWMPPVQREIPQLLNADNIVLRPRPDIVLAGERVTGANGKVRQFIAARVPPPPHARLHLLVQVQIGLSMVVIGAVGWLIARSIARPVAALQQAAQRMGAGDLSARVGGSFPAARDELGLLAREFDTMAGRIEALVQHERAVLQDISHELRSPLARLQLIVALAQRDAGTAAGAQFERAEAEIARLDRLIGELLGLSRMEADLPGMTRERIDLNALAAESIELAAIDAVAAGVHLVHADPGEPVAVDGNAELLARAIDNLLSNAIKFGAGHPVEVRASKVGNSVELAIRDHGPGVPAEDLPRLFRPFFRGSNGARAEGQGLGLTIADRIARAHGGQILAANAEGGGLRVALQLPCADGGTA